MPNTKATFKNSILVIIQERLASISFYKKETGFSRELGKDTSGYVGLPVSSNLPKSRIGISPVVGITFRPIEDLLKMLSGSSLFLGGVTLTEALGYLTPEKRFLQWVFDPALPDLVAPEIAKIIRAVEEYGLPFMEEHITLNSIIAELEAKRFTVNDLRRYRLPAAYFLVGRREDALKFVEGELRELYKRTDEAATEFRHFAQAFKDFVDSRVGSSS